MKNPAVEINATAYLADMQVAMMTIEQEGQMIRSIREAVMRGDSAFLNQFPFLGRLTLNDDKPQRPPVPLAVRKRVMKAGVCALCGSDYKLELDHIMPWSKGGTHDEANLQCLCKPCNRKKSNKI